MMWFENLSSWLMNHQGWCVLIFIIGFGLLIWLEILDCKWGE